MTVAEAIAWAAERLAGAGVDPPLLDAELLVAHAMGGDRVSVITHPERSLSPEQDASLRAAVARRVAREPLPYILGWKEFYGRRFRVSPAVLIPRPETELLVDVAAAHLASQGGCQRPLALDVGTGSGCVAITLALEVPNSRVVGYDISEDALGVAMRNAVALAADRMVAPSPGRAFGSTSARDASLSFRCGDFPDGLEDLVGAVDVLASNPPYVAWPDASELPPEVAEYEPLVALYSDEEGMGFTRRLVEHGPRLLKRGGAMVLEVACGQGQRVAELFASAGLRDVRVANDLAGIPRVVAGVKR
jgi:release factor glutamine methyltransferase